MKKINIDLDKLCIFYNDGILSVDCLLKLRLRWKVFSCDGYIKGKNKKNCPLLKHKEIMVESETKNRASDE